MTYAWMLYAVAVSLLLGGGAWALESACQVGGRPLRWVWAVAMPASVLAPVAAWVVERLRPAPPAPVVTLGVELRPLLLAASSAAAATPTLEERLLAGWAVLSAVLLCALAVAAWLLRRRAARWGWGCSAPRWCSRRGCSPPRRRSAR